MQRTYRGLFRHQGGARPPRRPGGLLRQRNFRLLWAGETVSGVGNAMAVVGMPLVAVVTLHASTFTVAALNACGYVPWLVIGLPAGVWVNRLPPRALMITCDVMNALLFASVPVAGWAGALTITQAAAVALLAGAANVFFTTAYQVYLPALVRSEDLLEGNAKLQGSASVSAIAGRSGAGLVAQIAGAGMALLANGLSFLVSALCLCLIPVKAAPARGKEGAGTWKEMSEAVRYIVGDPYLRPITVYAAAANLPYSGIVALTVVFLVRVAGLPPSAAGLLVGLAATGGLLGAMSARRLTASMGTGRALIAVTLVTGLAGLLIPLTRPGPRAGYYIAGSVLVTAGLIIGNIIMGTFRQLYCPPAMLARAITCMRFLVFGTIPLGSLIAGGLGTALGVRNALWIMTSGYALSGALLLTPRLMSARNLPVSAATDAPE